MGGRDAPRTCIFCFQPATSREHLLPCWLQKILPSKIPVIHTHEIVGDEKRSWEKAGPFREKTRQVCKSCNHGWMSELEGLCKPLLTPAITRKGSCGFDLQDQWLAALWATKTNYVLQTQAPRLLTPRMRPFLLRENKMPAPQVSIFVGSHARALDDPINSVYIGEPLSLVPNDDGPEQTGPFGYLALLAVAGISFLIFEHRLGNYVEVTLRDHLQDFFTKIWPRASKVVDWPPKQLMDRDLFDPFLIETQAVDLRVFPGSRHHMPPFSEAT